MSTHQVKLHGDPKGAASLLSPVRALGVFERRGTRRRGQDAERSATSSMMADPDGSSEMKAVYWVGDERDTTQGDW